MSQPALPLVKNRSSTERHPQVARGRTRRRRLVEQPDAAGVALALLDQRLDEDAEEAGDVRLADEQIERQLDGIALDARHALGAAALVDLARQGVGPCGSGCGAHQLVRDRGRGFREFTRAVERLTFLRLSSARLHAPPPRSIIRHRQGPEDGGTWPSRTSSESRRPRDVRPTEHASGAFAGEPDRPTTRLCRGPRERDASRP